MDIKVAYAVPWIEVEFGQRDEGHAIFLDEKTCIEDTKKASRDGAYDGGYIGPERPLHYIEIPLEYLEAKYLTNLLIYKKIRTDNNWSPKFKGQRKYIK